MIVRAQRATAGAALAAVMLLVGAPAGDAAHSSLRHHRSSKHHAAPRHPAKRKPGVGVARFNREAFPYTASVRVATEAKRNSMIVLQSTDGALVRRLHAANHKLKVLVYQDVLLSSFNDPHGFTTCIPNAQAELISNPGWFLRDRLGRPIASGVYQGYHVMNVGSPSYQATCVAHAVAQARQSGFDGIFMDGVTAWAGWTFPGVTAPLYTTPAAWQQATTPFVSYLGSQAHAHGLLAVANIGGSRITPGLWQRWTSLLDGSMEESWTDGGLGLTDQILDWPTKLANMAWSEAHHKYALLHSFNTSAAGNAYGLASMLLVAGGYSSYSTNNRGFAAPEVWRGIYVTAQRLGAPTGAYRRMGNGVYVRRFRSGIVLVNPTAHSVRRFSLSGRYKLGGAVRRSTTMAPTSGLILRKAG